MLEEEKWTTPSMTYFRPHFMMPALGENPRTHDPPMTNGWLNSYDQALDLGQNQQNAMKQNQHKAQAAQHTTIKHEQVDHSRYGFDQVNYSAGSQPSTVKKKPDETKYACDQCSYVATQKSSLSRHKQTQHEGIKPQVVKTGKTYDCDLCPYQASQMTSLKRHTMAKHSGQQYPCDKCEYIGTTPNNLKLHKASKHDGIRYACDVCGYQATQTGGLNRHKELKHGHQRGTHNITNVHHKHYTTGGPQGGQKALRGPTNPEGQPRQPLSGFFHFSNVGRAKVKAANPLMTDLDVSKELSRRWHALDEVTKAMFEELGEQGGHNEYVQNRNHQNRGNQVVQYNNQYRQKRARKDPSAPKRSLSAFMFFSNHEAPQVRRENPNYGLGEVAKELGRQWSEANQDRRQKYTDLANTDKERYEKEKHEWHTQQRSQDMGNPNCAQPAIAPSYQQNQNQPQPVSQVHATSPPLNQPSIKFNH